MKNWTVEEIKSLIIHNDKMVARSVKVLYERQTMSERITHETTENNGIGFNGVDAPFLTSCAQFYEQAGFLTPSANYSLQEKTCKI